MRKEMQGQTSFQKRSHLILQRLRKEYYRRKEDFATWNTPLDLVVATVLSAQCTDRRVNEVTKTLFLRYATAQDYANADLSALEQMIYSTGFFKQKARFLRGIGQMLVQKFHGAVPETLEELLQLPGVSYKTAYLILSKAFHKNIGVAVDTHVHRVAPRLGLTTNHVTQKISHDLGKLYATHDYLDVNEFFILHGRKICKPKPWCAQCCLQDLCPSAPRFLKK